MQDLNGGAMAQMVAPLPLPFQPVVPGQVGHAQAAVALN